MQPAMLPRTPAQESLVSFLLPIEHNIPKGLFEADCHSPRPHNGYHRAGRGIL
jgi:hypothetical protein